MSYPTGTTPNAITTLDDLKNKIVNKTVQPGQWLTPDDVNCNFGIELPKGYYAMAMKVSRPASANGFILPKTRVNVVAMHPRPEGRPSGPGHDRVAGCARLAVDPTTVRPGGQDGDIAAEPALLAVKPADSQRLTLAQSMAGGDCGSCFGPTTIETHAAAAARSGSNADSDANGDIRPTPTRARRLPARRRQAGPARSRVR